MMAFIAAVHACFHATLENPHKIRRNGLQRRFADVL
jgi:hypothetical protein